MRRVITLSGELDLSNAPDVKVELMEAIDDGVRELVVDLSDVTYIDSSILGAFVIAAKRLRDTGEVAIICPQEELRRIFEATGLDRILNVSASEGPAAGV